MAPSRMPSQTSVRWARRARGVRNSGTAFAIASTPVSAEQPEANAFSTSRMPTRLGGRAETGPSATAAVGAEQAADDDRGYRHDERQRGDG